MVSSRKDMVAMPALASDVEAAELLDAAIHGRLHRAEVPHVGHRGDIHRRRPSTRPPSPSSSLGVAIG